MGFFKKLFKPFKKLGKFIKKAFKKVGKWFGKLGIFGQIALSFIPALGPMLGSMFKGLGQGALRMLSTGLKSSNVLVKGAATIIDTARSIVGGIQKGFKTVTSAATSFVKNTTKYLGNKMGFDVAGPTKFFGKGTDSVFGQVGREVSNNFAEFQEVIGGALKSPATRATLIDDKLNITKVGGVAVDIRDVDPYAGKDPAITRGMSAADVAARSADVQIKSADLLQDFKLDLATQVGPEGAANFEKVLQGADFKDLDDFGKLKSIHANPNYFNKVVYAPENSMKKWTTYNSAIGTEEKLRNPFGKIFDIDSSTQTMGQKMREGLSLKTPSPGKLIGSVGTSTATSLLTNAIMGGGQQVGDVGPQFSLGQFYQPNLGRYDSQLQESQYAYGGLDPSLVTSAMSGAQDYNQLLSGLMGQDATQSQGMYKGTFQPLQTIGLPQYGTSPQF
jgi:hypothetical protein|tara:strand:+ start:3249 stop:4586 length:1338 start_codon:yes stop_codon:yes gene_type:complete